MTAATGSMKSLATPGPAIALVVVAALIALAIATGGPVILRQVVSGLMLGAIYMIVAVAFTLTIGVLNFLNFTIPSLFMLTGMVAWAALSRGFLTFAGGSAWLLEDHLSATTHERDGSDLQARGLYVDAPPWQSSVFAMVRRT